MSLFVPVRKIPLWCGGERQNQQKQQAHYAHCGERFSSLSQQKRSNESRTSKGEQENGLSKPRALDLLFPPYIITPLENTVGLQVEVENTAARLLGMGIDS